ncbi:hypothetical protein ACX0HA_09540 [Flavobacterium hauense]
MKRNKIYYLGTMFTIVGFCLLGCGIGNLFDSFGEGVLIGLGLGLVVTSLIFFKTYRRLLSFEKDYI